MGHLEAELTRERRSDVSSAHNLRTDGAGTPRYVLVGSGPDHDPEFRVAVHLPKLAPAEGSGRSKRAAEQAAAAAMMAREGVKPERANG